jgi:hypothetical protein
MMTSTFKHYTTAIIGLIESERDINFDRTNHNGVKFEAIVGYSDGFSLHYSISFGGIELMKNFYGVTDPQKVTLDGIISAVKDMAEFLEENKYIDQFELQTLISEKFENS